jgi:hypothetical protein
MREAAAAVSLDRVLVETDSPFLAPQRLRGTDNAPRNVVITLAELATVRDEPSNSRRGHRRERGNRPSRASDRRERAFALKVAVRVEVR